MNTCTAYKVAYGVALRCTRPHKHKGNHRWAKDEGLYPLGRLDPDDPIDQAMVRAWNSGAKSSEVSSATAATGTDPPAEAQRNSMDPTVRDSARHGDQVA